VELGLIFCAGNRRLPPRHAGRAAPARRNTD